MPQHLQDFRKVDLNRSVIDHEHSDPKTGEYTFIEKVYVDYQNPETRPPWYFSWCRWTDKNNYAEFNEWRTLWKFSKVVIEDGYWPEGVAPDSNGNYTFGDLIWVKCPLKEYIDKRKHEIEMSESSTRNKLRQIRNEMKADGVDLDEKMIRTL
jgi:hypothetical protein